MYTKNVQMKIGRRPYCSESGPQSKGPTQYPQTKRATVRVPTSSENPNCCWSAGIIADGALLENVLRANFSGQNG
jgi:hypothetical protein